MPSALHSDIREAAEALDISVDHLESAAVRADQIVRDAESELTKACPPAGDESPYDVVVLGSVARGEVTVGSDVDYLVIAYALPPMGHLDFSHKLLKSMDNFVNNYSKETALKAPGATGIFGKVVAAADLFERIGLEQDTNLTQTRRVLLYEESRSIYRPDLWDQLIQSIIGRYLHDNPHKNGPPRFLINDTIRYWRTLAVDYQAKRWDMLKPDWGLRYLKLIITRKLTFAGTMASLLLTEDPARVWLHDQFRKPPLARLAQLHSRLEKPFDEDLRTVLEVAEEFVGALGQDEFRIRVRKVESPADSGIVPEFDRFRKMAQERLQPSLERLFFESGLLKEKSRKYLSF
ncbi:MAG: nucleotidyltransferase domain-containing protein [Deltaproteobacteria bacterium]|nr:nucleotidyltransferase domain-containing protein [Deltaproteobacteria bacterium]